MERIHNDHNEGVMHGQKEWNIKRYAPEPTGSHHDISGIWWMKAPKTVIRSIVAYQNTRWLQDGESSETPQYSVASIREWSPNWPVSKAKHKSMMTIELKRDGHRHEGVGIMIVPEEISLMSIGFTKPRRWIRVTFSQNK
jgi:hypothetical protein